MVKRRLSINNKICKTRLKPAFSLAEVLVSMLIMSLFFLATTKVISVKQKPLIQEYPHGYYECYNSGGYKEHRVASGREVIPANTPAPGGICTFEAPRGIPDFNLYVFGSSGFYKTTESSISSEEPLRANPDTLLSWYRDIEQDIGNPNFLNDISNNLTNGVSAQFRTYLELTYRDSITYRSWAANSSRPPFNVLFITW